LAKLANDARREKIAGENVPACLPKQRHRENLLSEPPVAFSSRALESTSLKSAGSRHEYCITPSSILPKRRPTMSSA
jgi:hypothetical protein